MQTTRVTGSAQSSALSTVTSSVASSGKSSAATGSPPVVLALAGHNNAAPESQAVSFVDALPWPAMLLSEQGRVLHVNPAMASSDETAVTAVGGEFSRQFPSYASALAGSQPWLASQQANVSRTMANGAQRFEQLSMCRLPKGAYLLVMDETERWKLETSNVQTIRLASLGFMLASVSHEVRNPLTAIHSMVQIMQANGDSMSGQAWKSAMQNIAANVRSLLAITRKLTMFSRTDQEPQASFQVDHAVEEAILLFGFDSLGETVQVDHGKEPKAVVHGCPGQLQQVVYNILLNAAQAMRGKGSITISTRLLEGDLVDIAIRDTGPGIPAENLALIFDPFFTTKPHGEGTGLGLALSNEIAHEHGGHIEAENPAGGGACFHILLPTMNQA